MWKLYRNDVRHDNIPSSQYVRDDFSMFVVVELKS